MTLAPEKVAPDDIRRLVQAGVIIAAGHTASDYETVRHALKLGLTGFTHLYNAMPPLAGRDPGPVGAALEDRARLVRPDRRSPPCLRRQPQDRHRRQGDRADDAR